MFPQCNYTIPYENCTVTTCCLAQSNFNYLPSYGGNLFYAIFFGIFAAIHLVGFYYRTWGFAVGLIIGLVLEVLGYAERVALHNNPFAQNPFLIYLVCITIAPVFIAAGIYLCFGRVIIVYGDHCSYFRPRTIALTFMTSDFLSLVCQALGGAVADSGKQGSSEQKTGIDIMIAGLVLQAISLTIFLVVFVDFGLRCRKGVFDMDARKVQLRRRAYFKWFVYALLASAVLILIRSIYRATELWQGFDGTIWNDQSDYMVLDGAMVGTAVILLTVFHPGLVFAGEWSAMTWTFKKTKTISGGYELAHPEERFSSTAPSTVGMNKSQALDRAY